MSGLNPHQKEAVNTLAGPMLVLAGAGTGKTRVITFRIANLIRTGTPPDKILGMTFTNKAANEMKVRIGGMLKGGKAKKLKKKNPDESAVAPTIATFHSLCVRILRRQIEALGYPKKFAIYNRGDQEALARTVLREIRVADNLLTPAQLLFWIGHWKCKAMRPRAAINASESDAQHLAAIGYQRYQKQLKLKGCVDFDDLLLLTEELFQTNEDIRKSEADRFEHILVDEYQDTNDSQYRIVKALAERHRNLCVVGDDDQSIYGWRGAEVEHILSFRRDWPDAKVIRLEDNYRSTEAIIGYANTLIQFNSVRHDKVLRAARGGGEKPIVRQFENETLEAQETVYDIRKRIEGLHREPRDFAILFRTNEQPRIFETELRKAKLPYVLVGGMSFFDRKEVKDLLAYLRLVDGEPDEVSILRVINTPPRGIGSKSTENLLNHAIRERIPLWDLVTGKVDRPKLTSAANRGLDEIARTVRKIHSKNESGSMVDLCKDTVSLFKYRSEVDRIYNDPDEREARWVTVEQIVNAMAEYESSAKKPSLNDFLDKLLLGEQDANDEKEKQLKKNAIALMTMHSAKGLEFPEVYIVGMEEGIMPHHRSLEEGETVD
ncbi:MAG: UvrD-helicase domain-containing protein, partial [Planctomycetota bacterium]